MGGILNQIATVGDSIPTPQKLEAQDLALQNQRQSLAMGKVQLQEATDQQQARHAVNELLRQNPAASDADVLAKGGQWAVPYIQTRQQIAKTQADLLKTKAELAGHEADYAGGLASMVKQRGGTVEAFQQVMGQAAKEHPEYAQHIQGIAEAIGGDPTKIGPMMDQIIAGSPATRKVVSEETAANARQTTAQVGVAKLPGELQVQGLGIQEKQQKVTGTEPIQPAQEATIANTQAQRAETARHNAIEERQGGARVGIAGAELNLKQKQFNATFGAGLGEDGKPLDQSKTGEDYLKMLPAGIANQVRAMAEGRMAAPSASSRAPQAMAGTRTPPPTTHQTAGLIGRRCEYVITPEMIYGDKLPVAPEGFDLEFRPPLAAESFFNISGCVSVAGDNYSVHSPRLVLVPKPAPPKPRRWIVEECGEDRYVVIEEIKP